MKKIVLHFVLVIFCLAIAWGMMTATNRLEIVAPAWSTLPWFGQVLIAAGILWSGVMLQWLTCKEEILPFPFAGFIAMMLNSLCVFLFEETLATSVLFGVPFTLCAFFIVWFFSYALWERHEWKQGRRTA